MTVTPEEQIIDAIRIELRRQGWTQRGLAQAIGMKESLLSKILNGRRSLRVPELADIAQVLNLSVDALLRSSDGKVD